MSWVTLHPIFDEVTEITDDEAKDAINYMKTHDIKIVDLPDEKAVRKEFEKALKENPEANVGHWDHGSPDAWIGDDEKPVLDLDNVKLVKGREVFASNCSSGKKLGVEAYKQGCKVYFGYKDVVSFTTDSLEEFKEAFNYWIKRRIDGFSPIEAFQKTKEKMTELIDILLESGRVLGAACMRRVRDIMICYTEETPPGEDETDCWFRRRAIRLLGAKRGWKIPSPIKFLKRVPKFIWILLTSVVVALSIFWPVIMQIDHMFWDVCSPEEQAQMWIPEFGWTYRNCFILFINLTIIAFHILIVVIVWLTAWHLKQMR